MSKPQKQPRTQALMLDHQYADDGLSYDEIGSTLGLSGPSVVRIENDALIKMRLGMLILEVLGRGRAERVLIELSGRSIADYHRALERARRGGGGL